MCKPISGQDNTIPAFTHSRNHAFQHCSIVAL